MRTRLLTISLGLSLTVLAGCVTSDPSATDRSPNYTVPSIGGSSTYTWTPTTAQVPAATDPAQAALHSIEQLPSLQELGSDAPRLNILLRPKAWREVAIVQMSLNAAARTHLAVDGHFGPDTDAAVRTFQTASGIEVDGYVGPETLRALIDALSAKGGAVPPPTTAFSVPSVTPYYGFNGGTVCADGWISTSTGSGTCSWHGGIR